MSDDLVNQLTLNYLISKNQLQKLNKKLKETTDTNRRTDREIYGERIKKLFEDLLVNNQPDDLLGDVKTAFDFFVDKAIYYFKAKDDHELLELERSTSEELNLYNPNVIHDDIDYDKEERDIANGNYKEEDKRDKEDNEEDDQEDQLCFTKITGVNLNMPYSTNVRQKHNSKNKSVGVDNIESLPLNWFQTVKCQSDGNKIIPRTKHDKN